MMLTRLQDQKALLSHELASWWRPLWRQIPTPCWEQNKIHKSRYKFNRIIGKIWNKRSWENDLIAGSEGLNSSGSGGSITSCEVTRALSVFVCLHGDTCTKIFHWKKKHILIWFWFCVLGRNFSLDDDLRNINQMPLLVWIQRHLKYLVAWITTFRTHFECPSWIYHFTRIFLTDDHTFCNSTSSLFRNEYWYKIRRNLDVDVKSDVNIEHEGNPGSIPLDLFRDRSVVPRNTRIRQILRRW